MSKIKQPKINTDQTSTLPLITKDFSGKDILSLQQFTPEAIDKLFKTATLIQKGIQHHKHADLLKNTVITLLFYEPSSRTFGSFATAIKRLGGQTLEILNPQVFSSVSKGETLHDTIKVFESYSDAIVMRHFEKGAAQKAAASAEYIPLINAGDGIGEHPTQALLDLFTIFEHKKSLKNLKGLFVGDLKNGRTVHSLIQGLSLYPGNTLYLLAPQKLKLDQEYYEKAKAAGVTLIDIDSTQDIPKDCDFWYWTRVQKERFASEEEYKSVNNQFIVDQQLLNTYGNKNMILMHPLPRVGEIKEEVDSDPRAVYLTKQIKNGLYIRMALLGLVLEKI